MKRIVELHFNIDWKNLIIMKSKKEVKLSIDMGTQRTPVRDDKNNRVITIPLNVKDLSNLENKIMLQEYKIQNQENLIQSKDDQIKLLESQLKEYESLQHDTLVKLPIKKDQSPSSKDDLVEALSKHPADEPKLSTTKLREKKLKLYNKKTQ